MGTVLLFILQSTFGVLLVIVAAAVGMGVGIQLYMITFLVPIPNMGTTLLVFSTLVGPAAVVLLPWNPSIDFAKQVAVALLVLSFQIARGKDAPIREHGLHVIRRILNDIDGLIQGGAEAWWNGHLHAENDHRARQQVPVNHPDLAQEQSTNRAHLSQPLVHLNSL